LLTPL
jgi:hypothetical protein